MTSFRIALAFVVPLLMLSTGCERPSASAVPTDPQPATAAREPAPPPAPAPSPAFFEVVRPRPQPPERDVQQDAKPAPERQVLRPADDHPRPDEQTLADLGIRRFESQRLVLYTDIDPEIARTLPPLIDAAWEAWVDYFGPLPPAEDGSEFQLTGCLMRDTRPFLEAGLLPEDLIDFEHGRHRGYRFWMHEQRYDYYRRHLLIHEGTHCFMMILPELVRPPLFYLEGMAELFGSHSLSEDGKITFGVMPDDPNEAVGFGRIEMIQQAVEEGEGEAKSLDEVLALDANAFTVSRKAPYAWSWALCKFLDTHPRYRDRFRQLAQWDDGAEFNRQLRTLFAPDLPLLRTEWEHFVHTLTYGYDIERNAIEFRGGEQLPPGSDVTVPVAAEQGWQSSGVAVEAGRAYRLVAEGEAILANEPRPWVSEPPGVTIRYAHGYPIGRVLAAICDHTGAEEATASFVKPIDAGSLVRFVAPRSGTLYLSVNDDPAQREDNSGKYRVSIEALAGEVAPMR